MRDRKREAARRVSLLLVIVGWCVALGLCSCEGKEERAARMEKRAEKKKQEQVAREKRLEAVRLSIVGLWKRGGETIEFTSDGKMIIAAPEKSGRVRTVSFWYSMEREGQITLKQSEAASVIPTRKGSVQIYDGTLNLKMWDEGRKRVYYRVPKGVMGKR